MTQGAAGEGGAAGGSGAGAGEAVPPGSMAPLGGMPPAGGPDIPIEEEMQRAYLDYAMSVIVSRAIPDLRDGLKPVHRRILYAMHEAGYAWNKPYRKSARVVGDVIGKYHPHGDQAVYDALVRMAQPFSMRAPLLDGQGNFGSMDGDPPAAMRYSEVRMAKITMELLADIAQDTVDFLPNYDGQDSEPQILPARYPNLLVNGAGGIAVGMATNIPPHNLGEIVDATLALIEDPSLSSSQLMKHVPGPDFPTGGVIVGSAGARAGYLRGRGAIVMRARTHIEEIRKDRSAIIVDEIPYQVNKASLVERIAELARDRRIEGIAHVRDESDRHGVRLVIELKREATAEVVLNQLFRFSPMQSSFGMNMLALNKGRPETFDLAGCLRAFIDFRMEVVTRRTWHALGKARDRAHVLCGLSVAVANVDEVVRIIRASPDPARARARLMAQRWSARDIADYIRLIDDPLHPMSEDGTYALSDAQARAILDLRLQRLTALGQEEIGAELLALSEAIRDYLDILRSDVRVDAIIAEELRAVRGAFASERRTQIVPDQGDFEDEDFIEQEEMVVSVTHGGYIKRTPLAEYRAQRRGGKGLTGMATKDADFVTRLFVADTHTPVLIFTSDGMVFKTKVWQLPASGRNGRGKAIVNFLPIRPGVSIAAMMPVEVPGEDWQSLQIAFATSAGNVRRSELSDFVNAPARGKIAIRLAEGVQLVGAAICEKTDDVFLATRKGNALRFPVAGLRIFKGRDNSGVRGIRLRERDRVVSMSILTHVDYPPEAVHAWRKRRRTGEGDARDGSREEETDGAQSDREGMETALSSEQYADISAREQNVLIVSTAGFGKRTSAFAFRAKQRGGQGVQAMKLGKRGGEIVAAFPVDEDDQIMLVTNSGRSIRCPVADISAQSRVGGGVRVFTMSGGERVVSVARLADIDENGADIGENGMGRVLQGAGGTEKGESNR